LYTYNWGVIDSYFMLIYLFALENTAYVFSDSKPHHNSRSSPVQVSRIASSCVLTN